MEFSGLEVDFDLDAGDELDSRLRRGTARFDDAGDGIVVRQRDRR